MNWGMIYPKRRRPYDPNCDPDLLLHDKYSDFELEGIGSVMMTQSNDGRVSIMIGSKDLTKHITIKCDMKDRGFLRGAIGVLK